MNIQCLFCKTPAIVRNNSVWMMCMCDDEFRTARLLDVENGWHDDRLIVNKTDQYLYSSKCAKEQCFV